MKNRIFITVIISTFYLSSFAQTDTVSTKRIKKASYGIGYSHTRLLDNSVSMYNYKSDNVPFHFRYNIEKEKTIFEYNFNGIVGFNYKAQDPGIVLPPSGKDGQETPQTENIELSSPMLFQQHASVRYLAKIHEFRSGKLDLFLGGEIREHFLSSAAESPTFTFVELGLNCSVLLTYQFNSEHSIKINLASLVVGARVNLPKANIPEIAENGPDGSFTEANFTFISSYKNNRSNSSIEYVRQLSDEWSLACEYSIYNYRLTENTTVKYYDNSLVLKLTRKL